VFSSEVDGVTVEVKPGISNDMVGPTIGVIWSDREVSMNQVACRGCTEEDRVVMHLKDSLTFCSVGRDMEYITNSDYLMGQWKTMVEKAPCDVTGDFLGGTM
jgi:hypothetical protein